jgi:hypothetical protein
MKKINISLKIKICFICFLLIIVQYNELSQSVTDFLPLKIGNSWVYHCSAFNLTPPCFCSKYIKIKIVGTNVINGKIYYQSQITTYTEPSCYGSCNNTGPLPFDSLIRVDSLSGKVLRYSVGSGCVSTPNETLLDSLKAHLRDTIWIYCQSPVQWNTYVCGDTSIITIFGLSRQSRVYGVDGFEGGWSRRYVKGIGVSNSSLSNLWCPNQTSLVGCVIDGIIYGDTSLPVGIIQISSNLPEQYSLSQNYPNPFNPTTKIKFEIPSNVKSETSNVKIIIYDILGKEVATLVNDRLQPGTYEVEFDGSNYPSGVYFYKLITNSFNQTKRMVLIK